MLLHNLLHHARLEQLGLHLRQAPRRTVALVHAYRLHCRSGNLGCAPQWALEPGHPQSRPGGGSVGAQAKLSGARRCQGRIFCECQTVTIPHSRWLPPRWGSLLPTKHTWKPCSPRISRSSACAAELCFSPHPEKPELASSGLGGRVGQGLQLASWPNQAE
jgi:hypothetical protein